MQEGSQGITAAELADRAGCSYGSVLKLFKDGKIEGNRINAKRIEFDPAIAPRVQLLLTKNGKDGPVAPGDVSHDEVRSVPAGIRRARKAKAPTPEQIVEEVNAMFQQTLLKAAARGRRAELRYIKGVADFAAEGAKKAIEDEPQSVPALQMLELRCLRYLMAAEGGKKTKSTKGRH
jgi:AcrR family transcriptional regulator